MRFEQIRCDFCEMEIYANRNGKKIADKSMIKVGRIDGLSGNLTDKVYCSIDCLKFAVEQIHGAQPTYQDYLEQLSKKMGYKLTKKEEQCKS